MLVHLSIKNLAIVKTLDIDFRQGLSVVTGETGAGKSIAIDALGLCLGERAEASMVRAGNNKAEVCATFDIKSLKQVNEWLAGHDLCQDDEANSELLIRRVVSSEGRSKAYINGSPAPLQQLKELGLLLVNIHGQHAHQLLLKAENQRQVLDRFADHQAMQDEVKQFYQKWLESKRQLEQLQLGQQQRSDRRNLLAYQVQELDEFALIEDEFTSLESEHKKLSHSQTLLEQAQQSFYRLYEADEHSALTAVQSSLDSLSELQHHDPDLGPIVGILNEALINIDEASVQLRHYADNLEIDPMRMNQVEQRYSQAMDLARKHNVNPEQLYQYHQSLVLELAQLNSDDSVLDSLQQDVQKYLDCYLQSARKLSKSRHLASKKLAVQVESYIQQMNMDKATFTVDVNFDESIPPSAMGLDKVAFMISTNPGIQADTLDKVVSGGELSRIGLAIQVISTNGNQIPTMIFDEVDTGISGPTASVVGKLLRKLGTSCQVICVTHLPQVAASGHQQMFVTKFTDDKTTETHMICLKENERIEELARLLAGDVLTSSAIANAEELLNSYQ
ncbi:MAG: DNA repair protein RecN [Aliiglaciecola sp.]